MIHMPTLRQLRYFVALVRHRHFGRAAAECHVSQSAFSIAIRELEAALARCRAADGAEFPAFAARVDAYVAFHWAHMRKEEVEVKNHPAINASKPMVAGKTDLGFRDQILATGAAVG